jgi:phage terminase large subunit-like protein
VLLTACGARGQPLIFAITTAGFDMSEASICWLQHEYAVQLLAGAIEDDAFFAFIATLDEGDDWQDENLWSKSNPNLGVSLRIEDLKEEAERAAKAPTSLNPFMRYKLNVRTSSDKSWLTEQQWQGCNKRDIDPEALKGRACYLGLDLSKKIDTSAVVAVFPPEREGDDYIVLPFIFLPGETLAHRERTERTPWLDWKRRGMIHVCTGKVILNDDIIAVIQSLDDRYDVKDIVYDRWRAPEILPALESMGWSADLKDTFPERFLIEMGQGFKDMSPAIRILEELVTGKRISHGGHPVLSWMVSCVAIVEDDASNVKFSKKKSNGKIDAVVALAMALFRARVHPIEEVSVYEERGVEVIAA